MSRDWEQLGRPVNSLARPETSRLYRLRPTSRRSGFFPHFPTSDAGSYLYERRQRSSKQDYTDIRAVFPAFLRWPFVYLVGRQLAPLSVRSTWKTNSHGSREVTYLGTPIARPSVGCRPVSIPPINSVKIAIEFTYYQASRGRKIMPQRDRATTRIDRARLWFGPARPRNLPRSSTWLRHERGPNDRGDARYDDHEPD